MTCVLFLTPVHLAILTALVDIQYTLMGSHHTSHIRFTHIAIPTSLVTEKAFHKNAKTCRAGFHKKPTKQDGTHMTIRSQITIPTSIFPTTHTIIPYSLFWNGCVYLCVVNSRIGLWGLWVGVCIEGSRE